MERLTAKQEQVMDFLRECVRGNGYPPTMREIGERFGFTFPAAKGHLKALQRKGFINLEPGKSRGIELLESSHTPEALALPLVGDIRAGVPILAHEDISQSIYVDRDLFKDEDSFTLRVKGDSMMEAGIFEGDYIIVRPQAEVKSGEIGVALVGEDEATVKKIYRDGEIVRLVPCNNTMEPTEHHASNISIIGKVTGVVRKI